LKKVLIIQTAFIGDVILATALLESIRQFYKENVEIDILVRRGNEALVQNHPFVHKVFVWDKKSRKYKNLFVLAKQIRTVKYDVVFNLQRFASTGFLTFLAKATAKVGFRKNPFAFSFTHKIAHEIGNGQHEIERNHNLLKAVVKYCANLNYILVSLNNKVLKHSSRIKSIMFLHHLRYGLQNNCPKKNGLNYFE
jgi:heptosyltransferase-2